MIQNSLQSFTMRVVLLFVLGALCPAGPALSHGRLIEPPSRASAWRYGFATPHNYNDHELYCGGLTRQWRKNGGHCGVCGDAWDQKTPRPHEFGGRFGQGVTVRRYAVGATVSTRVELTAYHAGFYELRVCPHMENTTQECLDKHLLEMEGGGTRYYPQEGNKIYEVKFKLPSDLMCEHCVMQWRYIAGNNWGTCANGTTGMGCGHQEEFRACADIAIAPAGRIGPSYVAPTRRPTTTTTDVNTSETADGETGATGATTESSTPDVQIKLDAPDLPAPRGSWLASLLPAGGTLLAVLAALALIYLYYYRGDRIKSLLKSRGRLAPAPPVVQAPPTRPPRHRKPADTVLEVRPDLDSKIEPGFETIKLNEHRII